MLAEVLPPERMLYFNFHRETHLRPIPRGARRITSQVIASRTGNKRHDRLVGHDPGASKGASIFLDAFKLPKESDPVWWVRGEIFHRRTTTEQNGLAILEKSRVDYGCNLPARPELVHVRAHPYGQAEDKPDLDLYRIFREVGLDVRAAQYTKKGKGTGLIKKDSRIEMVNRLLRDASGRVRLYIDIDRLGQPCAPKLVESLEQMERDDEGRAETEAKDEHDQSDPPAALGYGVWPWEKPAAAEIREGLRKAA